MTPLKSNLSFMKKYLDIILLLQLLIFEVKNIRNEHYFFFKMPRSSLYLYI